MLTGKYLEFYNRIAEEIPKERMYHDSLTTLAFGTDASFYRLIPKLVIKAYDAGEVRVIMQLANEMGLPVTFRAAGTSLSGQSISDSILVIVSHGFTNYRIDVGGERITLEPGIRGTMANRYLAKFGKKIGPDPASIDSAMIGGIAANNASGMCCGTDQNSYKTVSEIDVILPDGSELNTADPISISIFIRKRGDLLKGLEEMSKRIREDETLRERIIKKYKIKNTTGYSLNAFVDYTDGIDIFKHLMIGSEGTLGFIASITYNTVDDHKFKALSLMIFPTIKEACSAVQVLKEQPVSAVELIDRAAIRSVDQTPGIPEYLKTLPDGACGLLVEARGEDKPTVLAKVSKITRNLKEFETLFPIEFTLDAKEQAMLWKVRKETLPTVAGMRKAGTTAIIEDICFPVPRLAEAVTDLRKVFEMDGYDDAVIFGHALAGNLHFMFNQNFGTEDEVNKYAKFMDDIAELVVAKYDGSLKAEHGTGRNMAPYVEKEWGEQAYALMKEVKQLFDPKGILNPGVILNDDKEAHLKNLKPCPQTSDMVDKCMECGFCERTCVAEGYTFSPRQRVASFREIKRLEATGEQEAVLAEMKRQYQFMGKESCATDSLCALTCPVKVDTGKLVKELRHQDHSEKAEDNAVWIARHMNNVMWWLRACWNFAYAIRMLLGKKLMGAAAGFARKISCGKIPAWNKSYPTGGGKIDKKKLPEYKNNTADSGKDKVVYMPSCLTRTMGTTKEAKDAMDLTALTDKLLRKAGYEVVYPKNLKHLCCGMAFSSKGYVKAGKFLSDTTKAALEEASENGKYPIICDMTPCLYTLKTAIGDTPMRLYEPAEFTRDYLINRLNIRKLDKHVAVFHVCTSKKLAVNDIITDIAKMCAKRVTVVDSNCCGFAGDKGFFQPELNRHGLRNMRRQVADCTEGYATSRTCEIGMTEHSGLDFKSLLYLVDEASEPAE